MFWRAFLSECTLKKKEFKKRFLNLTPWLIKDHLLRVHYLYSFKCEQIYIYLYMIKIIPSFKIKFPISSI